MKQYGFTRRENKKIVVSSQYDMKYNICVWLNYV